MGERKETKLTHLSHRESGRMLENLHSRISCPGGRARFGLWNLISNFDSVCAFVKRMLITVPISKGNY